MSLSASGRWRTWPAAYRSLSEEDLPQVKALMRQPDVSTRQICQRFDISKATLYRYVGPDGELRR